MSFSPCRRNFNDNNVKTAVSQKQHKMTKQKIHNYQIYSTKLIRHYIENIRSTLTTKHSLENYGYALSK